jgi:hypothetical protein
MTSRFDVLAVDCHEPRRLAEFWCAVLGYSIVEEDVDGVQIAAGPRWIGGLPAPGSLPPAIDFLVVPDSKVAKNRLHMDLRPVGISQEEEVARLLALGARRADVGQGPDVPWVVLADPEGNEFCVLRAAVQAGHGAGDDSAEPPHGET